MSSLPKTMHAVEISAPGGPEVLKPVKRPVPKPGPRDILLKVAYAGVNRPDALQRAGSYKAPPTASDLPGLEASGEVVAVGDEVENFQIGDLACALLPGGGYAEYVITPAAHALRVPKRMQLDAAACLPETFFTVYSNLYLRAGLKAGESLLVHGGSSGIGTTAIQLASALGSRVFTTAGSAEKCKICTDLGAEQAINYREADFVEAVKAQGGADVILDMVGGSYIPRNIKALKDEGRLVMIAFLEAPKVELNFAQIMMRRLTVTGSTLRPQSDLAKARIAEDLCEKVWPLLDAGRIKPVMDSEFPLDQAAKAHERMETSQHIGKIVLRVGG